MKNRYKTEFKTIEEYQIWKALNPNLRIYGTKIENNKVIVDYLVIE